MKKLSAAILLITIGHCAFSQNLKTNSTSQNSEVATTFLDNAKGEKTTPATSINSKAIRAFEKSFKNASGERWYEMPDGYRAKFTIKGMKSDITYKVDYDKKGSWTHTILSYDEKELAKDIRDQVKTNYFDYSIVYVDCIMMPHNQNTYVIHLEGATNWINVRIADGEMDELQKYNK